MLQDDVKENLLSSKIWLRILLMAGFMLAVWVVSMVVMVVMIVQTVTVLITGERNPNLQRFGALSAAYLYQVVNFLVFGTDEKPFPFTPFPEVADVTVAPVVTPAPVSPVPENMPPDTSWADDLSMDPDDELGPDQGERG